MIKLKDTVTINTTFKMLAEDLSFFENELRAVYDVVDLKIITDTEKLYTEDSHFKKLVKAKKEATKQCELYINRHNGKQ